MKWTRHKEPAPPPEETERLEDDLRSSLAPEKGPEASYWQNLIVRTNQRVDAVSSGKAISLSWALRVALPGAVAILFFFIGLHYYTPDTGPAHVSVTEVVSSLPASAQDSLYHYFLNDDGSDLALTGLYGDAFDPDGNDAQQWFLSNGETDPLLESLSSDEVNELLTILQTAKHSSLL